MDRAELRAMAGGDAGILALGVDADDRTGIVEQIGNDGPHALAGARRRDRQQMGGTGVAQQLARFAITADQQAFAILGERARLAIGGEAGRTVGVIAGRTAIAQDQRLEEGAQRDEDDDQRSEEHTSELQTRMRISYAVLCLKKKITNI